MHTMAINLAGYFLCARRFAEQLIAAADPPQGTVVNVSSIGGSTSLGRGNFVYGVSKGGVEQLTRELAVAWAPRGIRSNAVAPCQIATDGLRTLSASPSAEGRLIDTFRAASRWACWWSPTRWPRPWPSWPRTRP